MNTEKIDLIKEIKKTEEKIKKKVPESGMIYAVYRDRVEYEEYCCLTEVLARENLAKGLLELHLFDEHKEYRYIKKRKGFISELISDDDSGNEEKNIFEEQIYTEDNKGKEGQVCVVNYMTFDKDDLLQIEKYRLKEVE